MTIRPIPVMNAVRWDAETREKEVSHAITESTHARSEAIEHALQIKISNYVVLGKNSVDEQCMVATADLADALWNQEVASLSARDHAQYMHSFWFSREELITTALQKTAAETETAVREAVKSLAKICEAPISPEQLDQSLFHPITWVPKNLYETCYELLAIIHSGVTNMDACYRDICGEAGVIPNPRYDATDHCIGDAPCEVVIDGELMYTC